MAFNGDSDAFIGAGVMGEAMIKGLLHQQVLAPENIVTAADPQGGTSGHAASALRHSRYHHGQCGGSSGLMRWCCRSKPQVMGKVLPELRGQVDGVRLISASLPAWN